MDNEDIKILEEFIEAYSIAEEVLDGDIIQSIQNLIARYKELKEENKRLKYSCAKATEIIDEYTNETEIDTKKLIKYQEKYLNNK